MADTFVSPCRRPQSRRHVVTVIVGQIVTVLLWTWTTTSCSPMTDTADKSKQPSSQQGVSQKIIYKDIIAKMDFHVKRGLDCAICHKEGKRTDDDKQEDSIAAKNAAPTSPTSPVSPTSPAAPAPADTPKPVSVILDQAADTEVSQPQPPAKMGFDMNCCVNCHRSYGKQTFCAIDLPNRLVECHTCHRDLRTDVKPQYHYQNWLQRHSGYVEIGERPAEECAICHGRSGCTNCHRAQKPKSHTNFWRQRAHGLVAGNNREQCKTCHTADYCRRCHESNTPRNHTAAWGRNRNLHCLSCHEPLAQSSCSVCHRTHHPNAHAYTGQNCRACHKIG